MPATSLASSPDRWIGGILVTAVVVGVLWAGLRVGAILLDDPVEPGEAAPPLTARTLEGAVFDLADHAGEVVLLDFFSRHCIGCVGVAPMHNRLYERFGAEGLVVVGVNQDPGDPEAVVRYVRERPLTYPVVLDEGGAIADAFGVRALPHDVLIGRDGRVRARHRGGPIERALAADIERALAAPAPPSAPGPEGSADGSSGRPPGPDRAARAHSGPADRAGPGSTETGSTRGWLATRRGFR